MTIQQMAYIGATPGYDVAKRRFDAMLVRYDAWFVVLIAVILTLGATLLAGMAVWCVVNRKGRFTGHFYWKNGWSVGMECVR